MTSRILKHGIERHLLVCCICRNSYKQPKVLPCYHVNCQKCLEKKVCNAITFHCPVCKRIVDIPESGVQALPDFVSIDALASKSKTRPSPSVMSPTLESRLMKLIETSLRSIRDITVHNKMVLALSIETRNNIVFVDLSKEGTSKPLQDRILKACCSPINILSLYPFKDTVAVKNYWEKGIKLVSGTGDDTEFVEDACNDNPGAFALTPQGQLVYSTHNDPKSIKVIEDDGRVRTIFQNPGNDVLESPWHMCVNSRGEIIVSDSMKHEVIIIDKDGNIVGKYSDFKSQQLLYPDGVCAIRNDDILVCDRQKQCITRLNPSGKFIADILPGIDPVGLCYRDPDLYVGLGDGNIQVYQLY